MKKKLVFLLTAFTLTFAAAGTAFASPARPAKYIPVAVWYEPIIHCYHEPMWHAPGEQTCNIIGYRVVTTGIG